VDVRPDYEFKTGHLPGAKNFEIDLGDWLDLKPQKADAFLREKVKMRGIGAGSKKRSAAKFRKQKNIAFPLFADEKREIFECLGKPVLPVSYLVQRQAGKRKFV
jgi:hypothetical protein